MYKVKRPRIIKQSNPIFIKNESTGNGMKKHTRIYMKFFGLGIDSRPLCEFCGERPIVDVHHIESRKMGGSSSKDYIENLIGLCRECHTLAHNGGISKCDLQEKHYQNLRAN